MKPLPMRLDSPYWGRTNNNWARLWKAYARHLHRQNQILTRDCAIEFEDRKFLGIALGISLGLNLWFGVPAVYRWIVTAIGWLA